MFHARVLLRYGGGMDVHVAAFLILGLLFHARGELLVRPVVLGLGPDVEADASDGEVDDGHLEQTNRVASDPAARGDEHEPETEEGDYRWERIQRTPERSWRLRVGVTVVDLAKAFVLEPVAKRD